MNQNTIIELIVLWLAIFANIGTESSSSYCKPDPFRPQTTNQWSSFFTGGFKPLKLDTEIEEMALNCSSLWNNKYSGSTNFYKIECVQSAESQVVAGILYRINATLVKTNCLKAKMAPIGELTRVRVEKCEALSGKNGGERLSCLFKYWVQLWTNKYELTENPKCVKLY